MYLDSLDTSLTQVDTLFLNFLFCAKNFIRKSIVNILVFVAKLLQVELVETCDNVW